MPNHHGKENNKPSRECKIPSSILIPSPTFALSMAFRSISIEEEIMIGSEQPSDKDVSSPIVHVDARRPSAPTPEHPKNRALLRDCFVFQPILQEDERRSWWWMLKSQWLTGCPLCHFEICLLQRARQSHGTLWMSKSAIWEMYKFCVLETLFNLNESARCRQTLVLYNF